MIPLLLDCTMRDGGYTNNWNFSKEFAINYYNYLNDTGFDYVELGFLNKLNNYRNNDCGNWRSIQDLSFIEKKNTKISVMIDYSNRDLSLIPLKNNTIIDMIRVAFHKHDLEKAILFCHQIKQLGYIVSANAMATFNYTEQELIQLCQLCCQYKIDYLYIADSYGCLLPKDIQKIQNTILNNLPQNNCKIGIHLHNNRQNAFTNALYCLDNCFNIIDTTVLGMGRGAGNLCSELLISHLINSEKNLNSEKKYKLLPLLQFAQQFVQPILGNTLWGYNLGYLVSSHFECHPNYISFLFDNEITDITQIWKIIEKIHYNNKHQLFDKKYIENLINKKICICIPARYNSSRLPGKLLYKFGKYTTLELTYLAVKKCQYVTDIYILTDSLEIKNHMKKYNTNIILTNECQNGTERISKYLHLIPSKYNIIVNIQADEPFIDSRNIDYAIEHYNEQAFYTTLHQQIFDHKYLQSTSCVKVMVNKLNEVMLYSRNIIPWNKNNNIRYKKYYSFTGIYVFNRQLLEKYHQLDNTESQLEEDIEQLKILDHGYKIKSYEAPYFNEISLNDKNDYQYLLSKYINLI